MTLRQQLEAELDIEGAQAAIDVFAAWASGAAAEADRLASVACPCVYDHIAAARAFRHVAEVLTLVYDAKTVEHPRSADA